MFPTDRDLGVSLTVNYLSQVVMWVYYEMAYEHESQDPAQASF